MKHIILPIHIAQNKLTIHEEQKRIVAGGASLDVASLDVAAGLLRHGRLASFRGGPVLVGCVLGRDSGRDGSFAGVFVCGSAPVVRAAAVGRRAAAGALAPGPAPGLAVVVVLEGWIDDGGRTCGQCDAFEGSCLGK